MRPFPLIIIDFLIMIVVLALLFDLKNKKEYHIKDKREYLIILFVSTPIYFVLYFFYGKGYNPVTTLFFGNQEQNLTLSEMIDSLKPYPNYTLDNLSSKTLFKTQIIRLFNYLLWFQLSLVLSLILYKIKLFIKFDNTYPHNHCPNCRKLTRNLFLEKEFVRSYTTTHKQTNYIENKKTIYGNDGTPTGYFYDTPISYDYSYSSTSNMYRKKFRCIKCDLEWETEHWD
jgi:hypothetical protein